jgi:UDP:flavonoid glycosyltransferase YjiC (YdhE family)
LLEVANSRPDALVMVTTADAELPHDLPENFIPIKFANLPELAKHADVMLCQGGSGTLYPFMKVGQGGIITITTNADQQFNASLVEQHHLGHNLPISELNASKLNMQIEQMLADQENYKERLAKISPEIDLNGAEKAAQVITKKFNL